jgi:uncharacterized repeat protein (TIGR03803 family)
MNTNREFQSRPGIRPCHRWILPLTFLAYSIVAEGLVAQPYKILHEFNGIDGAEPWSAVTLAGTNLFGNTESGGSARFGTVFKLSMDGSGFATLYNFGTIQYDGSDPMGPLLLLGRTLYGTCYSGGKSGLGTLFKINTDGSGYAVLHHFAGAPDGANPMGCLACAGDKLYGTTGYGGNATPFAEGTVYSIKTDGTGFVLLHNFGRTYGIGDDPSGGLVLSGTTLFGTTSGWAGSGDGSTVFRLETDGSGFKIIASTGYMPMAPVVVAGDRIYGTTVHGTGTSLGTLFTVRIDGTGYQRLLDLNMPYGGLLLLGNTLVGTTTLTYGINSGTIFTVKTDGSRFTELKCFNSIDGSGPTAGVVCGYGTVYGTTRYGGTYAKGLVFSQGLPAPVIRSQPRTQTAEIGGTVYLQVKSDAPEATYQWFLNDTNAITGVTATSSLKLPDIGAHQSGSYRVVIENDFGVAVSSLAFLQVIPKVDRRPVPAVSLTGGGGGLGGLDALDKFEPSSNWSNIAQLTLSTVPQSYFDTADPLPCQRYYRAWQMYPSAATPTVEIQMVPAITLNGTTGNKVLVEAINQFGPVDAWFPLDTVTLTNNSQLYFDTSATHQPPRLYRLTLLP